MDEAIHHRWQHFGDISGHPEIWMYPDREPRIRHRDVVDADFSFACPQCKYNLIGVSGAYCPECGLALDYEPVTIFTAADLSLVWAAVLVLDRAAISNLIVTGSFDPGIGLFAKKSSLPHVLIPFKFFHEAAELLDAEFGRRVFMHGERPDRPTATAPSWNCAACGEGNPATFEICWQCSREQEPTIAVPAPDPYPPEAEPQVDPAE